MFRGLRFERFPPFAEQCLDLKPVEAKPDDLAEVHLFTGINGAGKTRLLCALAGVLGNLAPLRSRLVEGTPRPSIAVTDKHHQGASIPPGSWNEWPVLDISQGTLVPRPGGHGYWDFGRRLNKVPAFAYSGTAYIGDAPVAVMADMTPPAREASLSFQRTGEETKGLLQALAKLKVQAAMDHSNRGMSPTPGPDSSRSARLVRALEGAISHVTGRPFAFRVDAYPFSKIRASWIGQELPFSLLPDGLRSIIGTLAHAAVMLDVTLEGKGDPLQTELVLLLDEIESHLHPVWQRRILPAFQKLFPKAQIFVATHSPFVIASLNHGWIHKLTQDDGGAVRIEDPIPASSGDSYVGVVEDIMGLDEWFDPETEEQLAAFRDAREKAYRGDSNARDRARVLAVEIGKRSMELEYVMGRELRQMDRQLAGAKATQ